jgi:hypothetical protein
MVACCDAVNRSQSASEHGGMVARTRPTESANADLGLYINNIPTSTAAAAAFLNALIAYCHGFLTAVLGFADDRFSLIVQ